MTLLVQTFQLGFSTVVTLPKKLGIKPGEKFQVEKSGKDITLKHKKMTKDEVHKLVESLSGGLDLKYHPTPEEFNKALNERYEEMLPRR